MQSASKNGQRRGRCPEVRARAPPSMPRRRRRSAGSPPCRLRRPGVSRTVAEMFVAPMATTSTGASPQRRPRARGGRRAWRPPGSRGVGASRPYRAEEDERATTPSPAGATASSRVMGRAAQDDDDIITAPAGSIEAARPGAGSGARGSARPSARPRLAPGERTRSARLLREAARTPRCMRERLRASTRNSRIP